MITGKEGERLSHITDFLIAMDGFIRLQEEMLKEICEQYDLTMAEAKVVSFLHNNPEKDTAADIVELRKLQKGNVSKAVESLVKRSWLRRETDARDRRKVHLYLTEQAAPLLASLDSLWEEFRSAVYAGISEDEKRRFDQINCQLGENARQALIRRKKS